MGDADGLGALEKSDQVEPVQALGAGLVAMDLGDRLEGLRLCALQDRRVAV
jgi:hypothetical protein